MNQLKNKYFDGKFRKGFLSLYGAKTMVMISTGFLGVFLPIFLLELFGGSFRLMVLYYGVGSLLYIIFVPLGAQFLNKFGFRNALRASVFLGALFYVIFYLIDHGNLMYLIPLSLIVVTLYRITYWLPYNVDFAKFTDGVNRGRQMSALKATRRIITGFIPLLSGFIIAKFGFDAVFIIAIFLYFSSGIFYIKIPRTKEKFSWSYSRVWEELFLKENRGAVFAFIADGMEGMVGLVVWPVFIFELLNGDYFQVGALSAFIIVITILLQLSLGKSIDKKSNGRKVLRFGSAMYSIGWIIKIFISTAFHIFIAGVYHNLARVFTRTSFDILTYEIAADQGHFVDEFTILHEVAIGVGKVLMALIAISLSYFLPIQWTFAIAAFSAIALNMLNPKHYFERCRD
jgi:MFS family permease